MATESTSQAQLESTFHEQGSHPEDPVGPRSASRFQLILMHHCASARANYLLRVIDLQQLQQFAQMHDQRLWHCLCELLEIAPDMCDDVARSSASLPLVLGGLGLRSALRTREAGFWASWGRIVCQ